MMIKPIRVVILTTKLPEDVWLINVLGEVCKIEGIVLPRGTRWKDFGLARVFWTRLRRSGAVGFTNQALLVLYRLLVERRRDRRALREVFVGKPLDRIEREDLHIIEVDNINSEEVKEFITSKAPDLVIVSGTPILKEPIIESAAGRLINLHPGFAPHYRGRYGGFWPIYNKEPELVGTTVHFIDKGIDTGPILFRQRVEFHRGDTLKTVTYRQQKVGVDLIVRCLAEFETLSQHAYHDTQAPSRNYHIPGLTHYLKARRSLRDMGIIGMNSPSAQGHGGNTQ